MAVIFDVVILSALVICTLSLAWLICARERSNRRRQDIWFQAIAEKLQIHTTTPNPSTKREPPASRLELQNPTAQEEIMRELETMKDPNLAHIYRAANWDDD